MSKCSECGFLAIWDSRSRKFSEAHKILREKGQMEELGWATHCVPQCFILKADLREELIGGFSTYVEILSSDVRRVCDLDRRCDGFVPWIQGFHPKERLEMRFQDEVRKAERWHKNTSLSVAVFAVVAAILSGLGGAYMALQAARIGADATRESARWQIEALQNQTDAQREMTKMQIEAQKEIAKMTPPQQIIVRVPSVPSK